MTRKKVELMRSHIRSSHSHLNVVNDVGKTEMWKDGGPGLEGREGGGLVEQRLRSHKKPLLPCIKRGQYVANERQFRLFLNLFKTSRDTFFLPLCTQQCSRADVPLLSNL
jgi:hypothetical protein